MRVLVVEDEAGIRLVARMAFDQAEMLEASDGKSALVLLGAVDIDLVVLDIMLPGMDGLELLQAIRSSRQPNVPVVMLTAITAESTHVEAFRAGADAYIEKPFRVEDLVRVVGEILNRDDTERVTARLEEQGRAEILDQIEVFFG